MHGKPLQLLRFIPLTRCHKHYFMLNLKGFILGVEYTYFHLSTDLLHFFTLLNHAFLFGALAD